MAQLRARYIGRGVGVSAKRTAAEQEKRDMAALAVRNENYNSFDRVSGISNEYRSGEYKGGRYMTSDDFVRYFRNRNTFPPTMSINLGMRV
jgi:hypothetical protein